jgi:hypothetical protein
MSFVCPAVHDRARRSECLTFDKTDEKDAVLIARLAARLCCQIPERSTRPGDGRGTSAPAEQVG